MGENSAANHFLSMNAIKTSAYASCGLKLPHKGILWILCLFFIHLSVQSKNADTKSYIFVNQFSNEQGLRQSMVKQVFKDSRGFMWVITGDGLHLFDGEQFRAFRPTSSRNWESGENIMRHIAELDKGLFAISTNSSILLFNSYNSQFQKIASFSNAYPVVLPAKVGNGLIFWFHHRGYYFFNKHFRTHLNLHFPEQKRPPDGFIPISALKTPQGNLLIWGSEGILELAFKANLNNPLINACWTPTPDKCVSMASDTLNTVFVLTENRIYTYQGKGLLTEITAVSLPEPRTLCFDNENAFWISENYSKTLVKFSHQSHQEIGLLKNSGKHTDSLKPYIISSWFDEQNTLWLGTDGDGLLRYSPHFIRFQKALTGFTRCITSDNNSNLWVGTFKNGLWKLSPDLNRMQQVHKQLISNDYQINDLLFDSRNRLWVLAKDMLWVLNADGSLALSFPFQALFSRFLEKRENRIYVTTNHYTYTFLDGSTPRLMEQKANNFITSSIQSQGLLWLGTQNGLYVYEETKGFGTEFLSAAHQLLKGCIKALALIENEIWVSTGNGIKIFAPDRKPLKAPAIFEELNDETVYAFTPDARGRVWISLNKGLACISEQRDKIYYFDHSNNLQGLEFNSNAYHVAANGMHYWGGINGINGINPSVFNPIREGSRTLLLELMISDTLFTAGIPPQLVEQKISWKAPHVSGKVISSNYSGGQKYNFSFYLVNYDKDWNTPTPLSNFHYRNLPAGKYTLLVKSVDEYGNWGPETELLKIHVTTPFWKARWFVISSFLILVISSTLYIRHLQAIRYKRKIKELEHQNALERERMRISRDLHDDLGAGLSLIILNTSMAQQKIQDQNFVETHLKRIYHNAQNLYENMNNLIWLLKQETLSIENLINKMREVFSELLSEAVDEYEVRLDESLSQVELSRELSRNIFLLIKEAVNNSIKHAQASRTELILEKKGSGMLIHIIDNGKGFDLHNVRQGNGIQNMNSRATALDGSCTIDSIPGRGTHICIFVPLDIS